jgi:hypothetical protein
MLLNVTLYVNSLVVVKVTKYYCRGKSRDDVKVTSAALKKYDK